MNYPFSIALLLMLTIITATQDSPKVTSAETSAARDVAAFLKSAQ